jgi:hypothetical protein
MMGEYINIVVIGKISIQLLLSPNIKCESYSNSDVRHDENIYLDGMEVNIDMEGEIGLTP